MADEASISWHHPMRANISEIGPNIGRPVRRSAATDYFEAFGPVLYNTAGTARLAGLIDVGTSATETVIPDEAKAEGAFAAFHSLSHLTYVITGMTGDSLALGGGMAVPANTVVPIPIGFEPDGTQHTHIIAIRPA